MNKLLFLIILLFSFEANAGGSKTSKARLQSEPKPKTQKKGTNSQPPSASPSRTTGDDSKCDAVQDLVVQQSDSPSSPSRFLRFVVGVARAFSFSQTPPKNTAETPPKNTADTLVSNQGSDESSPEPRPLGSSQPPYEVLPSSSSMQPKEENYQVFGNGSGLSLSQSSNTGEGQDVNQGGGGFFASVARASARLLSSFSPARGGNGDSDEDSTLPITLAAQSAAKPLNSNPGSDEEPTTPVIGNAQQAAEPTTPVVAEGAAAATKQLGSNPGSNEESRHSTTPVREDTTAEEAAEPLSLNQGLNEESSRPTTPAASVGEGAAAATKQLGSNPGSNEESRHSTTPVVEGTAAEEAAEPLSLNQGSNEESRHSTTPVVAEGAAAATKQLGSNPGSNEESRHSTTPVREGTAAEEAAEPLSLNPGLNQGSPKAKIPATDESGLNPDEEPTNPEVPIEFISTLFEGVGRLFSILSPPAKGGNPDLFPENGAAAAGKLVSNENSTNPVGEGTAGEALGSNPESDEEPTTPVGEGTAGEALGSNPGSGKKPTTQVLEVKGAEPAVSKNPTAQVGQGTSAVAATKQLDSNLGSGEDITSSITSTTEGALGVETPAATEATSLTARTEVAVKQNVSVKAKSEGKFLDIFTERKESFFVRLSGEVDASLCLIQIFGAVDGKINVFGGFSVLHMISAEKFNVKVGISFVFKAVEKPIPFLTIGLYGKVYPWCVTLALGKNGGNFCFGIYQKGIGFDLGYKAKF